MPSPATQQHERRRAIARLLEAHQISRQSELVALLRAEGFVATQSSVSRDLKDLGVAKLKNGYSLPERLLDGNGEILESVADLVRDMRAAGPNLLVIRTAVGAAQRVAVSLDRIEWPEIVGTLSGDDTIFVATANSTEQRRLRVRLRQHWKKGLK